MKNRIMIVLLLLGFPLTALAETVYVKERQTVALRDGVTPEAQSLKNVATGVSMEVVERTATHIKVRLDDGAEGWIQAALLTSEKPTAFRILAAETRQKQAETEAAKLKAESIKLKAEIGKLQARLSQQPSPAEPAAAPESAEPEPAVKNGPFRVNLLWIAISFAMLVIGFVAGVAWLRERTRRKLGGMHIRVG